MVLWNHPLTEAAGMLAGAGFQTVEIWAEHLERTGEKPAAVRAALASAGIACTVHCPIIDVNICSTNRGMAAAALDQYREALRAAVELEARVFVFHPGSLFSSFDPLETYWKRLAECLHSVLEVNHSSVLVVVENMESDKPHEVVKSAADLGRVLASAAGAEVGVCWDTTHLLDTAANDAFLAVVPRVDHVHLSDARRDPGSAARKHLRLGHGSLDIARLLAHPRARQAGVVSLETVMIDPTPRDLAAERALLQEALDG
jgi:sugar phosphate isomerase/epimerase